MGGFSFSAFSHYWRRTRYAVHAPLSIVRIDSLQLTAKHKVATPVNWKYGEDISELCRNPERDSLRGSTSHLKPAASWLQPLIHGDASWE
jgi:hypothetical protein